MYRFVRGYENEVIAEISKIVEKFEILAMTSNGDKIILLIKVQNKGK